MAETLPKFLLHKRVIQLEIPKMLRLAEFNAK